LFSILTTLAPNSAKNIPTAGPAKTLANSTTFRFENITQALKIFSTDQIRAWDRFTIETEPITSLELMNRAARAFTDWFTDQYPDTERPVCIIAGTGNNGGDGLAVARLLHRIFYNAKVFVCDCTGKQSADFNAQDDLLPKDIWKVSAANPSHIPETDPIPANAIIIDALFGSGLSRPLAGDCAAWVDWINALPNETVSIDLPSGMPADSAAVGPVVQADRTFSFETPKLAFFFPENSARTGAWAYGPIGLSPIFAAGVATPFSFLTAAEASALIRPRTTFSHKGSYGHALIIAGSYGKMGAAVLAVRACLRAGAGLTSIYSARCGYEIVQSAIPEAMFIADPGDECWTEAPEVHPYSVIGVGPGIGTSEATAEALEQLLRAATQPLVLDADALNLLSKHPEWWPLVPENTVITPHPKEFERLFGRAANDFERNALQRSRSEKHRIHIVLKGAYTAVTAPDGACSFNSTGNPGMATGGSGDVLTGIITGLLAQGYPAGDACRLGVYLHGLAGDLAAAEWSQEGLIAGDLVEYLGKAWLTLHKKALG
jgi:NAD(P)H-hydrate epimerase